MKFLQFLRELLDVIDDYFLVVVFLWLVTLSIIVGTYELLTQSNNCESQQTQVTK